MKYEFICKNCKKPIAIFESEGEKIKIGELIEASRFTWIDGTPAEYGEIIGCPCGYKFRGIIGIGNFKKIENPSSG